MKEYLVFRIYSPISSWGDIAVGENRHSFPYPSKSALIGFLAAAFGYKREEEEKHLKLAKSIGFGVKSWNTGILLRDFHTVQVPPSKGKTMYLTRKDELKDTLELNTILSSRDYRMDAMYDICLWEKDNDTSLTEIQNHLKEPAFALYLGRKSCVLASPLFSNIIKAKNIFNAFTDYSKELENLFSKQGFSSFFQPLLKDRKLVEYLWEDEVNQEATETRIRRDELLSRKRWQFSERNEFYKSEQI